MDSGLINSIGRHNQVIVSQDIDWIECVPLCLCCEKRNKYKIFSVEEKLETEIDVIGELEEQYGNYKENKENGRGYACLFCCKWCREYKIDFRISNYTVSQGERPFKCGGSPFNCCHSIDFCKQTLNVFKYQNQIGQIVWPYGCICNFRGRGFLSCLEFDIHDAKQNLIYTVSGPCLQVGFLCWGCGFVPACSKREYIIKNPNGIQVGQIANIYNGIVTELFTRADKFLVKFPEDADLDKKLLLIQATAFLDYLQYQG